MNSRLPLPLLLLLAALLLTSCKTFERLKPQASSIKPYYFEITLISIPW